jgi:general secretion pathway protein E/type IV pilus assembly protein PilB
MTGNIIGIIAQRLIRRLCEHCKTPYQPLAEEAQLFPQQTAEHPLHLFQARGCQHCAYQGYRGRLAIMELLRINAELDELLGQRASPHEIRRLAMQAGFTSLADDGLRHVFEGTTSLDELRRVVDLSGMP